MIIRLLAIITVLSITACAPPSKVSPPAASIQKELAPSPPVVVLGPGDVIDVKFRFLPELDYQQSIRPDGKIDLSLEGGQVTRDKNATLILDYLKNSNGFAPVHDKSDPKLIADLFGMSKGAFKKTIGGLYKQRVISIEKDGIRLLK